MLGWMQGDLAGDHIPGCPYPDGVVRRIKDRIRRAKRWKK
jgi:hypothetical protein